MTSPTAPVPGPGILDIAPYVGGESKAAGVERPIRLASNESALGPSPKAVAAYRALAGDIHRYPDGIGDRVARGARPRPRSRPGAHRLRLRLGRADRHAAARLCRAGRRGAVQPARVSDVPDRRHVGRRHPGGRAGARSDGRCRCAAGPRDRAHADRLYRQSEQSDRHLSADFRDGGGCMPDCRRTSLLAIDAAYAEFVNRNDYRAGRRRWWTGPKTS